MKYPIRENVLKLLRQYQQSWWSEFECPPPTRVPESSSYIIAITTAMSRLNVQRVVISDRLHDLIL